MLRSCLYYICKLNLREKLCVTSQPSAASSSLRDQSPSAWRRRRRHPRTWSAWSACSTATRAWSALWFTSSTPPGQSCESLLVRLSSVMMTFHWGVLSLFVSPQWASWQQEQPAAVHPGSPWTLPAPKAFAHTRRGALQVSQSYESSGWFLISTYRGGLGPQKEKKKLQEGEFFF